MRHQVLSEAALCFGPRSRRIPASTPSILLGRCGSVLTTIRVTTHYMPIPLKTLGLQFLLTCLPFRAIKVCESSSSIPFFPALDHPTKDGHPACPERSRRERALAPSAVEGERVEGPLSVSVAWIAKNAPPQVLCLPARRETPPSPKSFPCPSYRKCRGWGCHGTQTRHTCHHHFTCNPIPFMRFGTVSVTNRGGGCAQGRGLMFNFRG
jgi:hypothetical protein